MGTNPNRRNVLMIMCDQLRPDFLGAYGSDFIPTPNIDALARDGVVFDNAITASTVCAPARMSFLTGQFVSGHDAWTNGIPLKEGVECLPERLNDDGYMTAAVGCYEHWPAENPMGYQYRKLFLGGEGPCDYSEFLHEKHPEVKGCYPNDGDHHFAYPEEEFYDRWSADCAIEFIESYSKTGKAPNGAAPKDADSPFFLYCGFLSPHAPLIPPREVSGTVDIDKLPPVLMFDRPDEDVPSVERYRRAFLSTHEELVDPSTTQELRLYERLLYGELIVEVDQLVGRVVQSLKDNGLYENTTIIFTSDHGSVDHDYGVVSKGPWPYRPQLFIPMIIANDPRAEKGTRCDALCGNLDIGATVLDIADDHKAFGVARSMLGLADGTVAEREVNMSEFCDSCKTLVDKRYTFTYYPFTGRTCLFDRVNDPEERINLGGKPEYLELERKFMMHVVDFMVLAKGVRLEAHDLVPDVTAGIEEKHPKFLDTFDIAHPLASREEVKRLRLAGLDYNYNEFCKTREIKYAYSLYFDDEK
ncbi:MAG: sulfatase-like hydrolase/transferase [Clostridia bacterium]|nr:sulfatase-like hydrolase/transferase [Clostridia bacterium]